MVKPLSIHIKIFVSTTWMYNIAIMNDVIIENTMMVAIIVGDIINRHTPLDRHIICY